MLLCFVFVLCLVFPMLPVSLECPFLIASLVFSKVLYHNTELKTYILTQVLWKGKTLIILTDFTSLFFPHS